MGEGLYQVTEDESSVVNGEKLSYEHIFLWKMVNCGTD